MRKQALKKWFERALGTARAWFAALPWRARRRKGVLHGTEAMAD